jgi:hypothetical protein
MPIILAIWEAEIESQKLEANPGKKLGSPLLNQ